ncbi:hypothetical protein BDK51DRAFT_49258, partial [Blyttiomyces helicus]
HFRPLIKNAKVLFNGDLQGAEAAELVASGQIDAAVFGRPFIANPDLPHRILNGLPLAGLDWQTLYGAQGGAKFEDWAKGYTDYPVYKA